MEWLCFIMRTRLISPLDSLGNSPFARFSAEKIRLDTAAPLSMMRYLHRARE
tara:strand:+ start:112601 stop:112756 length:156 start_codon:yes stop_codon:yes gene_type:complete